MDTAVLFETFARPQYARQVFDQIKKAKPKKLYFYSNKARVDRPDEVRNNEEIRSWVKEIDWDCELHTFFREEYVDVYTSVRGAMDWVFENEEQAIVLEDDCVPSVAFFEYCDFFLNKYKEDKSIGFISGANYLKNYIPQKGVDHIYCNLFCFYGFATWKDRWKTLDFNITCEEVIEKGYINRYYRGEKESIIMEQYFMRVDDFVKRTHCWDYIFDLNSFKNDSYGVYPIVNLVMNIGAYGVHTNASVLKLVKGVFGERHYPFAPKHKGAFTKRFNRIMIEKIYRNDKKGEVIKRGLKFLLGQNFYSYLKSIVKQ